MRRSASACLTVAVAIAAVTDPGLAQVTNQPGPRYSAFGIDLTAQNRTLMPGDDFWTYANGDWDKRTQIAADRTSAGYGVVLTDETE